MTDQTKHLRLDDHNARVLRLARDYDKKYRPVVVVVGKRYNLWDDQHSLLSVRSIARETWRYTDSRKPLSERSVKRLLSEMELASVLKPDPRQRPNGSQASSVRVLDFHQAIRFGRPVAHLWDAPLRAEDDTPGDTPSDTPVTPLELSSISLTNSLNNSVKTEEKGASPSREIERGPGFARPVKDTAQDDSARARGTAQPSTVRPAQDRAQRDADARAKSSGICNTFIAWEVKGSGKKVAFRKDKPPRHKPPKRARVIELSPVEASFMFRCLDQAGYGAFVLAKPFERASRMKMYAKHDARDRAKRDNRPTADELASRAEARNAAERTEREPLVQRWAELLGQDVDAVRQRVERIGTPHDSRMVWLKHKIRLEELKERQAS
jgi:hypothetical protein